MTARPMHHLRLARMSVGPPAAERLEDELGDGPTGDDDTERGGIDALLLHEQRQDRQQRAEAEHDDELGHEDGQQRTPSLEPCRDTGAPVRRLRPSDTSVDGNPSQSSSLAGLSQTTVPNGSRSAQRPS